MAKSDQKSSRQRAAFRVPAVAFLLILDIGGIACFAVEGQGQAGRPTDYTRFVTLHKLTGHTSSVNSATFSPDGERIVTASWDKTARIWDAATGRSLHTLAGHTELLITAAFSPDGRRIVTASIDNTARIWDAATARNLSTTLRHERSCD